MLDHAYDLIVGLETHVQLLTESKLFCGCSTKFGAPPNTQTCPVCTGLPGSLPVMNKWAFELSLKAALALTDFGVWRSLTSSGLSTEAAARLITEMLMTWLTRRSATR